MTVTNHTTRFPKLLAVINADACTWHSLRVKKKEKEKVIAPVGFWIVANELEGQKRNMKLSDTTHGTVYNVSGLE